MCVATWQHTCAIDHARMPRWCEIRCCGIILRYSGTVMVDVDVYSTVIQYKQATSVGGARCGVRGAGAWGRGDVGTWGRGTNRNETRYSLLL